MGGETLESGGLSSQREYFTQTYRSQTEVLFTSVFNFATWFHQCLST